MEVAKSNRKRKLILAAIAQLMESDSEDEMITIISKSVHLQKRPRIAVKDYIENVASLYDDSDFKSHYRLSRSTFNYLLDVIGKFLIEKRDHGVGPTTKPPQTQLLIALSMLCNQQVYRLVSEKFNVSKSTAWLYVQKVCTILTKNSSNYIVWPTGQKAHQVMLQFYKRAGFPGVLGAVDGTHIPITAPSQDQASYCNRHHYHSVILQGVCDANYMFTDVFAGYPGSVHDARVWHNSPLGKRIRETPFELFPNTNSHILGDSAYKCTNYLLTPYKDNGHLTRKQRNFNYKLSSTRVFIEQCYGLLKGRFRILKHVNVYNTDFVPKIIIACCVLHNICMLRNDYLEVDCSETNEMECTFHDRGYDFDFSGVTKRNRIADEVFNVV